MPPATHQLFERLSHALRSNGDGEAARALLTEAVEACTDEDPSQAEALLACLLETFSTGGDNAKAVLDDMLLELLPTAASLASHSAACCRTLSQLCSLAAAVCSPRDVITACLEVIGNILQDSPGPDSLQFACDLMLLLPAQVGKLSRRKAANAVECCTAAAMLAKVHGQVLASWSLNQMALAAQQATSSSSAHSSAAAGTLNRLDTFLAANWQAYLEFAQGMVQQVLRQESSDPESQATARQGLSTLVLQLLQHLTAVWQPLALRPLALQLFKDPGSAQLMLPSAESVTPPVPLLATAHKGQQQQPHGVGSEDNDAEAAVLELLQLLEQECDVRSWQQLLRAGDGCVAAGAGLAALYSSCVSSQSEGVLSTPVTAVETVELACQWCCAVVDESDNNILAILKALALLQLAASHANALHDVTITSTPASSGDTAAQPAAEAEQLLPHLQPCVSLLAGATSQAPVQVLRSQASLTLQQLLQGLPPPVCHACLRQLLSQGEDGGGVHPEVAALLMQEVRGLLVKKSAAGSSFSAASCVQLVMPWLLQQGPIGWQSADTLPDRANAVCAALAVVRLALLQGSNSSSGDRLAPEEQQEALKPALTALSTAVADALKVLQAANSVEQDAVNEGGSGRGADGRACVPGESHGAGLAVDAWLAVSRVQDVLDRVLELLC